MGGTALSPDFWDMNTAPKQEDIAEQVPERIRELDPEHKEQGPPEVAALAGGDDSCGGVKKEGNTSRLRYWTTDPQGAWRLIKNTPEARDKAINDGAAFFTMCALSAPYEEGAEEPHRWGDLCFDFDSKDDPGAAHEDVKRLVAHLEEVYSVEPETLRFFASGSKGFHVEVPAALFAGEAGDPLLPRIHKRMAARLAVSANLPTLDMAIYNMRKGRMWRIPNVKRANGRYKAPLAACELSLPTEDLMALTAAPRHLEEDDEPQPGKETYLAVFYDETRQAVRQEAQEGDAATPLTDEARERLRESIPQCVGYILVAMPPNSERVNFNRLVLQLVAYFRDAGYDGPGAWEAVKEFVERYPHSETYNTPQKRRDHWREIWRYLEGRDAYPFGCSYMKGFGFPGHAFECAACACDETPPLTRAEIEEKIQNTEDPDELQEIIIDIGRAGLMRSEEKRVSKLLARKMGCSAKDIASDARALTCGEKPEVVHLEVARKIITRIGQDNILTDRQGVWLWETRGVWKQRDDRLVKQAAHGVIPFEEVTKSCVESVLDLVKTETHRDGHVWDHERQGVNLLNGELHWTGEKWELRPHRRESYRTTQVPVAYNPAAKCPRFVRFLEEVFRDDDDAMEKAALICELIGYTLMSTCEREKFVMCIGPGANGKSVLLEVVRALVGPENVAAVQPSQFENRFQRAHLAGKLANLVTEIAEGAQIADAQLKAIVSGELTTAEHKHKPPFEFTPFCTCWFGTNHMPHTRDFSDALFRRAFILRFNRTFAEHEQDPHLKEKLTEELPGILRLGLDSYAEVIRRGIFTSPTSSEQAKRDWRVESDQVAQFVEEECLLGPDHNCSVKTLFDAYKVWANDAGVRFHLGRRSFTDRVKKFGLESHRGTGGAYRFSGIRPKIDVWASKE